MFQSPSHPSLPSLCVSLRLSLSLSVFQSICLSKLRSFESTKALARPRPSPILTHKRSQPQPRALTPPSLSPNITHRTNLHPHNQRRRPKKKRKKKKKNQNRETEAPGELRGEHVGEASRRRAGRAHEEPRRRVIRGAVSMRRGRVPSQARPRALSKTVRRVRCSCGRGSVSSLSYFFFRNLFFSTCGFQSKHTHLDTAAKVRC